jgi:hypothetical protein
VGAPALTSIDTVVAQSVGTILIVAGVTIEYGLEPLSEITTVFFGIEVRFKAYIAATSEFP